MRPVIAMRPSPLTDWMRRFYSKVINTFESSFWSKKSLPGPHLHLLRCGKSESFSESVHLVNLFEESNVRFFLVIAQKRFQNPLRCVLHTISTTRCCHFSDISPSEMFIVFSQVLSNIWNTAHTEVPFKPSKFLYFQHEHERNLRGFIEMTEFRSSEGDCTFSPCKWWYLIWF